MGVRVYVCTYVCLHWAKNMWAWKAFWLKRVKVDGNSYFADFKLALNNEPKIG